MTYTQQLRITLWKDYLLRKRKPGVIFLSCFCAVAFFSILLGVRLSLPPESMPTCQFRPRAMPSVGLIPFAQSFICSIGNECLDDEQYEEYPALEDSQMAAIVSEMQPLLQDETFIRVSKSLPKGVDLITIMADILSYPDIQKLLVRGIGINELFKNPEKLRNYWVNEMQILDDPAFDAILKARFNVVNVIKSFNPTNDDTSFRSEICDINNLNKYLIMNDSEQLNIISKNLCQLNSTLLRKAIVTSLSYINFSDILRMFGRVMVQLGHSDVFTNIGNMVDSIGRMQEFQQFLPSNFSSLSNLLPELLPLFQSINSSFIDFDLIQEVIEIIDPAMDGVTPQWSTIKRLSLHVSTLLKLIQNKMLKRQPIKNSTENIADLYQNLRMDVLMLQLGAKQQNNITNDLLMEESDAEPKMTTKEILGLSWKIANNTGSILDDIIIENNTEPILLVAKVLDEVKLILPFFNLFKEKTVIFNNILSLVNDLLIISTEGKDIVYRLSEKHSDALNVIVRLGPNAFNNLSKSLQDPDKVNVLLSNLNSTYDLFCSDENIMELFGVTDYTQMENIKFDVCSSTWLKFVEDIISELGFLEINQLLKNLNRKSSDMTIDYYNDWSSDSFYRLYLNGKKIFEYILRNVNDDVTRTTNQLDWTKLNSNFSSEEWQPLISDVEHDFVLQTVRLKLIQKGIANLNISQEHVNLGLIIIENLFDDLQQKLKIFFLKNDSVVYDMLQPMILKNLNSSDVSKKQNYLWKRLLIQEKNLYAVIRYLFQHKTKMFNFVNYEHLQDTFQQYWSSNIDIQTGFELCIQTITKLLELIDIKFDSYNSNIVWARLKSFILSLNEILAYFDYILSVAIENEKVDMVDLFHENLPKTQSIFTSFIVNLPVIINDFGKSIIDFDQNTEEIAIFMEQVPGWPCSKISTADLFKLKNRSAPIIREFEVSMCDNTILNEIQNSKIFSKILKTWKIFDHRNILTDWRKVSQLFHNIMMKTDEIKNGPKVKLFTDIPEFDENKIVSVWNASSINYHELHPDMEFYRKNLQILDAMFNKAPKPSIPLSEIENNYVSCTEARQEGNPTDENCDDILNNDIKNNLPMNLLKFFPTVIVQVNNYLVTYLEELSTNNATILQLMGFTKSSGPQLFYEHLADYILVFVHSFQQPTYQSIFKRPQSISCKKVFKYLTIPEGNPLTMDDIYRLGNYSCLNFLHVEVMEENLMLLAGQVPQILYYETYDTYNSTYEDVADSVIKLDDLAQNIKENNLIQKSLFTPEWIEKLKNAGYYMLNNVSYSTNSSIMNILNYYYQNTTWFEYCITVMDAFHKLTNSIQYEIENVNSTSLKTSSTVDVNQINTFRVLGYNMQTFIIEQFILRDDCNVTNHEKLNKLFLNESKLICSFDLSSIRKDLRYYYENETKLYLNDFIIEKACQDSIRTIIERVKDGDNSIMYLSSFALWQKVLYKLIPDMDKIRTKNFASFLYDTYKTHKVSDKLLKSIDDNHQLYTTTLNGFKGEIHFEEPNISTKSAVDIKKSDFENHVIQLQESLLYIFKNPKLLSFFNTSISTENFGNETQAVDKGIEIFHSLTQQINYLLDLSVYVHKDDEECKWCRIATIITKEAVYQISHFRRYVMLVCKLHEIQFNDLYNMLLNEFKWKDIPKKLADQKTQYNFVDFTTAIRDFFATTSVQITLAQSTGLFDQLKECAQDLGNTASVKNMKVYFKLFMDLLKFMGSSGEHVNDLMALEKKITPMFTYLQDKIQVIQPMNVIVIDTYSKRIKENGYSDAEIEKILNTEVYVNRLMNVNETENAVKYEKLFRANTIVPYKNSNNSDYRQIMIEEINWKLIDQQLSKWQHDRIWNFEWLSDILDKFDEIFENGNRIMDFEKNISFQKVDFNDLNIVDLIESILQFLQKSSHQTLIRSLDVIKNDLKPLTENSAIEDDLENISNGFQAMTLFVTEGFIPWKYNVSNLFNDWSEITDYFKDNLKLDEDDIEILKNSELNLKPILIEEKRLLNLKSYLCDSQKYNNLLLSNSENKIQVYKKLSEAYCNMNRNQTKQLYTFLIQHLSISTLFESFIQTTMNNILSKANITQDEIKEIFSNLKEMKDLIPILQEKFKNVTKIFNKNQTPSQSAALVAEQSDNGVDFLADASTLICGRPLIQNDMHVLKALSVNTEPLKVIDPEDYNDLPTPFCKELYVNILQMEAGKILWTYLKPIVRGRIVYSPKTIITDNIMNAANFTFNEIFEFEQMLLHLSSGANSVKRLINKRKAVQDLEASIKTPMMADLLSMILGNEDINLEEMKLQDIIHEFQGSEKMMSFVNITHELMKCIRKDRMVGVKDETELENLAIDLSNKRELIGGVVFTEIVPNSNNNLIPKSVKYKIRMDVDDVPSTARLRDLYWSPGPEADFIEDLRYFRGFIQIQNMIDQGIIALQSTDNSSEYKYEIYTQQFPYACWRKDSFVWSLYASQGFQACFFLALIGMVGTSIRYLIKERETRNTSLMKIMGLSMGVHYISWFISSIIEMIILMTISYLMFVYADVFPYSKLLIVYVLLLLFGFSVIMFSFMFSPLFKAASAASITIVMLYYLTYMPFIISYSCEAVLSLWQKVIINLFMSSSFSTSVLYMLRYEVQTIGINADTFWTSPLQGDTMNFGISFSLIIIDGILYGIIGYILTKYLTDIPNIKTTAIVAHNQQANGTSNSITSNVGVAIQNITKVYNTGKVALDNVNIQLYKGQITTLLGQNGAGKTTLINILTGMASPTKGQIIINDPTYSNLKLKRQYLGVCPQFSILLDTLTTREHLMFYAQLKSELPAKDVEEGVNSLIESMSLGHLANEPVQKLSEGTRRRISVAIAFTYGPSLVVLDEPSSGVDPVARRQIWDLIIKHKKNRTILLTTHHFDEADLLSDRIIILHKGKIHCSGTPLYLKENFGKGYQLDVTYYPDTEKLESIETNRSNDMLNALNNAVENISVFEIIENNRIIFDLPFLTNSGVPNNFEKAALILEQQKSKYGIEDYAFNCTTLEKVFVDICCKADILEDSEHTKLNMIPNINTASLENIYFGNNKPNSIAENDFKLAPNKEILTNKLKHIKSHKSQWYNQFMPLFKKRAIHYIHDKKALFCTLALPTIIAAIAMGLTLLRPPTVDEPPIDLNPNLYDMSTNFLSYNPHFMPSEIGENILNDYGQHQPNYLLKLNYTSQNCECTDRGQICMSDVDIKYPNPKFVYFWNEMEASNWIIETQKKFVEKRYGGWSIKSSTNNNFNETLTVWYNNKGHHSAPSYTNHLSNSILKSVCDDCSISTYSHPLKLSSEQLGSDSIRQHVADVGIALVLLCAYCLAVTCGVIYIIGERKNEEKRLQYLSGVSPNVYWIVNFIWDYAMFILCIILSMGVYEIFQLPVFTARLNLFGHLALLLLLGWSIIPLVHIGEKFFKDPSLGFIAMYFVNVALGIIPQIALLLIDIFGHAEWVRELRDILGKVFLLLPQFAFADGVLTITKNEIQAQLLSRFGADTYVSPLSWELLGLNYVCLLVYGILAFIINILIENKYTTFQNKKKQNFPMKSKYLLETVNLRKEFKCSDGIRVAVDSLSLKIPPGQCFGLLGVNGAGKSTTFKMLTTELTATSGDILIEDESIGNGPLTSGKLGYCSQMNSMDPKLSVWQSLQLYSKLKDISNINEEIHNYLELFGLTPYVDQRFENLSGGNKRKLCAAVAMLGNSPVILMDEPTSGMDPAARALIAKAIDDVTRKGRSVILTSHSMEECEALCSEVAILIGGKIHCIGSPQSLKTRFGGGYLVSIRLRQENQTYELNALMSKHFPNSKIENQQYCTSQFLIPTNATTLPSYIFNRMNLISRTLDITDYSIVRSTLDQVFINLVHSQSSSNDLESNDIGSSTDGISMSSFTNKTYQPDNVTVSRL